MAHKANIVTAINTCVNLYCWHWPNKQKDQSKVLDFILRKNKTPTIPSDAQYWTLPFSVGTTSKGLTREILSPTLPPFFKYLFLTPFWRLSPYFYMKEYLSKDHTSSKTTLAGLLGWSDWFYTGSYCIHIIVNWINSIEQVEAWLVLKMVSAL